MIIIYVVAIAFIIGTLFTLANSPSKNRRYY